MSNDIGNPQVSRTLSRYIRRFAFIVGMEISMSLGSISGNLSHSLPYYVRTHYLPGEYALAAGMLLLLALCTGLAFVAVGFRSGASLLVGIAALNALLSAGYLGNNPVTMFAVFALVQSLLGLLILNTRNHRRFVSMLRVKRRRKVRAHA
ncbi:hypothetical protein [Pseudomonas sp. AM4(2022)]|uniref:hypothetical protein n=1 Tax=Pseudomonas sp. AM4(2022) TaxID=2983408 RepID=UPI002E7FBC2E|nr:hypothetical protein [Pseudomonas sp. AM4(2022)]